MLWTLIWLSALLGLAALWLIRRGRMMPLEGRVVLITGGSRGLGLVLARQCLRLGAKVAVCGRDPATLDRAFTDLLRYGADVLAVPCDICRHEDVRLLVDAVRRRFGRVDVLINNAGVIQVGPVETMVREDYVEAMQTHFWGPLQIIRSVLPLMRLQRTGRIVNIVSIAGKIPFPHLVPYDASKFALSGLSQGLRAELAKDRILVTTVYPGLMRTGSARQAVFKGRHLDEYAWFSIAASLPMFTMSAERAAGQILAACRRGDAELTLTFPAWLGSRIHGLLPGLTCAVLAWVARRLPPAGGIGSDRAKGGDIASRLSPSRWTALSDRAAERNNELEDNGRTLDASASEGTTSWTEAR